MIKKFEKPIGSRLDQIIREAEDRLHFFYKTYGEWDGKGKKSSKKKSSDDREDDTIDQDLCRKNSFLDSKTKKINRPDVMPDVVPEVLPPSIVAEPPKKNEVSFEGLSSREIIEKVKTITGVAITICVKSKINVIRHAVNILKEKGFDVKV